jgi:transposase
MPTAIENEVKMKVIKQWLGGDTRDKIATDNQIGAGTVSGIINEWKKGVNALEYESVRELSISCKKQGITRCNA